MSANLQVLGSRSLRFLVPAVGHGLRGRGLGPRERRRRQVGGGVVGAQFRLDVYRRSGRSERRAVDRRRIDDHRRRRGLLDDVGRPLADLVPAGTRLLRSFMRDSTTQVVLGTFIATFLYCVLVLRTIRRADEILFVPHLSVTLGVLLAVVSVGVLIYFIHHVSVSIQANEIAARIGKELIESIDRLFPEQIGRGAPRIPTEPPDAGFIEGFDQEARPIGAGGDGYLQFIDAEALLALAMEEDLIVRLERKPGNYVVASCPLALIWPGSRVTDRLTDQVNSLFVLGHQRTSGQDIEFGVNQLVEIAVRALSPGLNDPFTAITCVDHLGSALCRLATRDMPSPYRHDPQKQLRVIAPASTFPEVMDAAFNQIRQYRKPLPPQTTYPRG